MHTDTACPQLRCRVTTWAMRLHGCSMLQSCRRLDLFWKSAHMSKAPRSCLGRSTRLIDGHSVLSQTGHLTASQRADMQRLAEPLCVSLAASLEGHAYFTAATSQCRLKHRMQCPEGRYHDTNHTAKEGEQRLINWRHQRTARNVQGHANDIQRGKQFAHLQIIHKSLVPSLICLFACRIMVSLSSWTLSTPGHPGLFVLPTQRPVLPIRTEEEYYLLCIRRAGKRLSAVFSYFIE